MLNVVILSVVTLNLFMLNVITLNVVRVNAVVPINELTNESRHKKLMLRSKAFFIDENAINVAHVK
jgi:hypothetical protein